MTQGLQDLATAASTIQCRTCRRTFPSQSILDEHLIARCCIKPSELALEGLSNQPKAPRCKKCKKVFQSQNKLFAHLRDGCHGKTIPAPGTVPKLTMLEPTVLEPAALELTVPEPALMTAQQLLVPKPRALQGARYTHMHITVKSSPDAEDSVEICVDSGCGNPIVDRTWLQSLEHTIEDKPPVFIDGVCGRQQLHEWATFSLYIQGFGADGITAKIAKFTCSAWVQDALKPIALLGTAFLDPYACDILLSQKQIYCTVLDDFYFPFEILQLHKKVVRRVGVARNTVIPAGQTRMVPAYWKEVPKDRSFAFHASLPTAVNAIVDTNSPPAVLIVNNTKGDIRLRRKQKVGNVTECEEDGYLATTWSNALVALTVATAAAVSGLGAGGSNAVSNSYRDTAGLATVASEFALGEDIKAIASGDYSIDWQREKPTPSTPETLSDAIFADIQASSLAWKQRRKTPCQAAVYIASAANNTPAADTAPAPSDLSVLCEGATIAPTADEIITEAEA